MSAFTLIELLVVISIIGVLSALLIPTVGMVRDQARMSECSSRMRQLGAVALAYTNDWDGWLPGNRMLGGSTALHSGGTVGLEDYYDLPSLTALNNSKYLLCPESVRSVAAARIALGSIYKNANFKTTCSLWSCYAEDGSLFPGGPITNISQISKSSAFFLLFCNTEDWFFAARYNSTNDNRLNFLHRPTRAPDGVYYYQSGKMNITFADGHVQTMTDGGTKNPCGENEVPIINTGANATRYTANWLGK